MSQHHPEDALLHFGVKGMRWGIRKSDPGGPSGVSRSTNKEAAKDAEEFTRAKLYYGQGAGTRLASEQLKSSFEVWVCDDWSKW